MGCILNEKLLFNDITQDIKHALRVVKLPMKTYLKPYRNHTIATKRALVYCYLYIELGYSYLQIATNSKRDHSTIIYHVKKHVDLYTKYRHKFL